MRRSSAPSFKAEIKRARFLSPMYSNENIKNDNLLFSTSSSNPNIEKKLYLPLSNPNKQCSIGDTVIRSNEDVLSILEDENATVVKNSESKSSLDISSKQICLKNTKFQAQTKCVENESSALSNCIFCLKSISGDDLFFNVLYCKRSGKKHKIWEGDGLLHVKSRSAVLKDLSGKVLDRGIGYKLKDIEALEDGSKFYIGGKECEIQSKIPDETIIQGKYCICPSADEDHKVVIKSPTKTDVKPQTFFLAKKFFPPASTNALEKSDVFNENCFVLTAPTVDNQLVCNTSGHPVTPVYVDTFLTKQLRNHQKEGIDFLYKCIMGFQHEFGQGAILADEMGLGKTLQCIALIWTLCRRGPYGNLPVLNKVVIITPSSLVTNWQNEFHKWLGKTRLSIYAVTKKHPVKDYLKLPKSILIISYEMFLRSSTLLSSIPFDLVICDEGHRIKNLNIKISNVVNCLSTPRRILLTGTPIQNDLAEFFSIVDFVNPGALGSIQYFRKTFEKPINLSRNQECSESEKEYGEERSEELGNMTKLFMLRRTQEVINQYLPQKTETVVFCSPSEQQRRLYNQIIGSRAVVDILSSSTINTSTPLVFISVLRKLCNHPSLLYRNETSEESSSSILLCDILENLSSEDCKFIPSDAGKMKVLESMLTSLFLQSSNREKIVIVSGFTKTLDVIELLCKLKRYEFLRLDGSTNTSSRQGIVDVFNCSYTKYSIFLLSSKAGGVGFNLIGASRIILYDIDWNPANDLQAMSRIWRDGQKRAVYVYRLLTTGTIEEKMFQRQLSKQCLSDSVLDTNATGSLRFTKEELKDLFTFHESTRCLTHDLINCKCLSLEHIINCDDKGSLGNGNTRNAGMAELMNWNHICGPISTDNCTDSCLTNRGGDITFIFQNTTNVRKM